MTPSRKTELFGERFAAALASTTPPVFAFQSATFFYGDRPSSISDSLPERWKESFTRDALKDSVSRLCEDLSRISGGTLSPAEVYRRGEFTTLDMDELVLKTLREGADPSAAEGWAARNTRPYSVTFHGNGFSVSWAAERLPEPVAA